MKHQILQSTAISLLHLEVLRIPSYYSVKILKILITGLKMHAVWQCTYISDARGPFLHKSPNLQMQHSNYMLSTIQSDTMTNVLIGCNTGYSA